MLFKVRFDNTEQYNGMILLTIKRITRSTNKRTIKCNIGQCNKFDSICFLYSHNINYLYFLYGLINSYVIDFLTRKKTVIITLNTYHINDIPIIPYNQQVTELAIKISNDVNNQSLKNELDVLVSKLYNISYEELKYILSTFNLVEQSIKDDILERYKLVI